jgi:hypothetical protein
MGMSTRLVSVFSQITAGVLILGGAFGVALAQDEPQGDDSQVIEQVGEDSGQANPPGRVAQLSDAEGSVSLEPAGTTSWTSAVLNRPLTLGDKLWTDRNSRAELDIGDAVIRLGSTTGFSFLNLDDQTAQMQVTAGTVIVHVRTLANGEDDEIDTPNLALTLQQPGTYRVEVSDTGDSTVVEVEDGEALATGGGQSYPVTAQQSVTFSGTNTLVADYATLGAPDSFDDWSMQRDQQAQQQAAAAQQYVPPDMVGGNDLGSYGTWQDTPDWGYAWFPVVAAGWAPYSMGRWVWVSPWGWTWVDEEPWGFAPFHYGRWGYWGNRWCWIPGPRRVRPVYAPALVGWVGGSPVGVSRSIGPHVGWFPLGPRDVYVPGYRASPTYVQNINITNTRVINTTYITKVYEGHVTNVTYANSSVAGAITAVPRSVFTSSEPVGSHRVVLPHQGGANFRATTAAPAITPVQQSVLGASAGRAVRTPPRALVDRPVVARLTPPRAPVSFAREQAAIRANGGRPLPMAELSRMRPNTPAAPVRFASPPSARQPGMELRTGPDNRRAPAGGGISSRERALQQPSLPPAPSQRNDRPPWAQGRPTQSRPPERGGPTGPMTQQRPMPQRQAPLEWHTAPQQQAPQRQMPERQPPEHFNPPERPSSPPEQRFNPPERQVPAPRFTPPPEREAPQQHYAPPPREERGPPPREAPPPRAPERRSAGRPPPGSAAARHASARLTLERARGVV